MLLDIGFVMMVFWLSIPWVAGYTARCYGRSFSGWFLFGVFAPVIAHFVLFFYIRNDKKKGTLKSLLSDEEIAHMEKEINNLQSNSFVKPDMLIKAHFENPTDN